MPEQKNILLIEDDDDDSVFFQEVINEIPVAARLTRLKDGMELMELLTHHTATPNLVFLDINMPRKNGFQCITEIRSLEEYKELPVIIFSTSSASDIINFMFNSGADAFIVKPNDFNKWKAVIERAINTDWKIQKLNSNIDNFVLA